MGYSRPRPKHLAAKLLQIRLGLRLSQAQMAQRLGVEVPYTNISKFERNRNEPPLVVLLAYARAANVSVEALIDDQITI